MDLREPYTYWDVQLCPRRDCSSNQGPNSRRERHIAVWNFGVEEWDCDTCGQNVRNDRVHPDTHKEDL